MCKLDWSWLIWSMWWNERELLLYHSFDINNVVLSILGCVCVSIISLEGWFPPLGCCIVNCDVINRLVSLNGMPRMIPLCLWNHFLCFIIDCKVSTSLVYFKRQKTTINHDSIYLLSLEISQLKHFVAKWFFCYFLRGVLPSPPLPNTAMTMHQYHIHTWRCVPWP